MTAKDIAEGLRNKNALAAIVSTLFLIFFYRYLPVITDAAELPQVRIFDPGDSSLSAFLENSPNLEARSGYESLDQLLRRIGRASTPELGLVVPAGMDEIGASGREVVLDGYLAYWVSDRTSLALIGVTEAEIARLLGRPARIEVSEQRAFPTAGDGGPGMQVSLAMILVVVMVGVSMIPHLILEEKQSRTLEVLLVSPASEAHIILAKALTGLFYCGAGLLVAMVLNRDLIVHWAVTLPVVASLALLTVSIGLWLGAKIDSRPQLMLWASVFIVPALLPVFLVLVRPLLPEWVEQILPIAPTSAAMMALNQAYVESADWSMPLLASVWILVCAGLAIGATVWLVRRRDRAGERHADRPIAAPAAVPGKALPMAKERGDRVRSAGAGAVAPKRPSPGGILLAIVAKDVKEALQNRTVLSLLVGTLFVVLNGAAMPALLNLRWVPSAIIVDEGRSSIVRGLSSREDVRMALADDREAMAEAVTGGPGVWIGLVIPQDFDARAGRGDVIELDGYVANWASPAQTQEAVRGLEAALGLATWGEVEIQTEGHVLYPLPEVGGQVSIQLVTLVLAVIIVGMMVVPLLMIEERESHTLDALLASPARHAHVIGGKALVGVVYSILAGLVVVLLNRSLIVHWEVALLATVLASAFAVSVGVLVGLVASNATAVGFWSAPILMVMIVPVMLDVFFKNASPSLVHTLVAWTPSSLMFNLFRFSVAGEVPVGPLWLSAGALAAMALAFYAMAVVRLRTYDR